MNIKGSPCRRPNISNFPFTFFASSNAVLGIAGEQQKQNAALALELANAWLHKRGRPEEAAFIHDGRFDVTEKMAQGLARCSWPGRSQTVAVNDRLTYYLDGAHTAESLEVG
jgi:folylpolyglutamate synthase